MAKMEVEKLFSMMLSSIK